MVGNVRETLTALAIIAQGSSYSPYSKFPVGAAVYARNPDTNGYQFFIGANVENASYGLTICAERVAIFNAVVSGYTDIEMMVCVTEDGVGTSCGSCRQVEYEFSPEMIIYFCDAVGKIISEYTPNMLLPEAFNKENLNV